MKIKPAENSPNSRETVPGASLDVEDGSEAVPVACDCGYEGQTSMPASFEGWSAWECPQCGARHQVEVSE